MRPVIPEHESQYAPHLCSLIHLQMALFRQGTFHNDFHTGLMDLSLQNPWQGHEEAWLEYSCKLHIRKPSRETRPRSHSTIQYIWLQEILQNSFTMLAPGYWQVIPTIAIGSWQIFHCDFSWNRIQKHFLVGVLWIRLEYWMANTVLMRAEILKNVSGWPPLSFTDSTQHICSFLYSTKALCFYWEGPLACDTHSQAQTMSILLKT